MKPKIWYFYCWFFTNLMIYFLYGGGLPFMYILGSIFFTSSYLVGKFSLFTWNQKAFGFANENVALYSVSLMKWALFFHMLMSLFIYSNKRLLTPDGYTTEQHYRPNREPVGDFFARRFDEASSFTLALAIIFIILMYLFWKSIYTATKILMRIKE